VFILGLVDACYTGNNRIFGHVVRVILFYKYSNRPN